MASPIGDTKPTSGDKIAGMSNRSVRPCPCGSRRTLQACCAPLLAGEPAPTAEALMRSRYTAYVLEDEAYLLATWHPTTRPERVKATAGLRWTGLRVVAAGGGPEDREGVVEFVASFRERGRPGELRERSRFLRENGRWYYLDGELG